jgi:hypothetical protein
MNARTTGWLHIVGTGGTRETRSKSQAAAAAPRSSVPGGLTAAGHPRGGLMTLFVYHPDVVRTAVLVGWERYSNSIESGRAAATKCSNRIELLWPQQTFMGS